MRTKKPSAENLAIQMLGARIVPNTGSAWSTKAFGTGSAIGGQTVDGGRFLHGDSDD